MPRGAAAAVRARALDHPRRARPTRSARGSRGARAAAAAAPRRQGDRRLERARARGARRGGPPARARRLPRRGRRARRVPARPALRREGRLHRTFRAGQREGHRLPRGLRGRRERPLELHVATGELRWLEEANRLARLAVELFADDERGGFFLTPADGEELVARKKDLDDHPTPSGNAMLAFVLLRLARIYGDDELERARRRRLPARPRRSAAACRPRSAMRCVRSTSTSRRRASSRSSARSTARSRAPRSRRSSRTPSSPSARRTRSRCSPERASSTASRRSTSASASPARRRSPSRCASLVVERNFHSVLTKCSRRRGRLTADGSLDSVDCDGGSCRRDRRRRWVRFEARPRAPRPRAAPTSSCS